MNKQNRICILGGGFGGLYTALRLNQLPLEQETKSEIILIDQSDRFVFTPLLYELITQEMQTWEIAPPFVELLHNTNIRFTQSIVNEINLSDKIVTLEKNNQINYDYLVLALGGETPLNLVPGAAEYALPFRTIQDAYLLAEKLRFLSKTEPDKIIRISVVGGGYSGVELACKLADRLGNKAKIRLIELGDKILQNSPQFNRETAQKALEERGIWLDLETGVENITADSISLIYKGRIDTIPTDIVLWTVGTEVNPIIKTLDLEKNERGRLKTTSTLQLIDHPEIFALGDIAEIKDAEG
ncbi:MAG TPA: FAD-dependent oxidoreductase, partial [Allocoleopsis sp.]